MTPLLLVLAAALQGTGVNLTVDESTLDNGMRVLVVPRRDTPRVYCALYWKVGSVNERPGITGLSHFFEHMMFKGTETIGTTNPKRDAEINAELDRLMTRVRDLDLGDRERERRGASPSSEDAARLKKDRDDLVAACEKLVAEQRSITVGEHLSKLFQGAGGTRLNASTYHDWTRYFVDLPSNKVELFFWLESDRFLAPVFREFYPERDVVKEERRMRYESTPTGLVNEAFNSMFWQSHPYGWPVIGWMSDIEMYTLSDANDYFKRHYSPRNCTAIFVGDVDPGQIKALAKTYFGRIPRGKEEAWPIVTREVEQVAERRMNAFAKAQPFITARWHAPSTVHADTPPLDLATMILDGSSGRLHRKLVDGEKLALDVNASYYALKYGGHIDLTVHPRPETSFDDIEKALYAEIEALAKNGPSARELDKVKNQSVAIVARQLQTNGGIADALGYAEMAGDWRDVTGYLEKIQNVTAEDVRRVAARYLTAAGRNVLIVKRQEK